VYRRGRRFENYVKEVLTREGYFVVRAAGSKPVDLVAVKDGKVFFVECKTKNYVSPEDREKLRRIAKKTKLDILIATHENGRVVLKRAFDGGV
jgi:Holliday junction resolvase